MVGTWTTLSLRTCKQMGFLCIYSDSVISAIHKSYKYISRYCTLSGSLENLSHVLILFFFWKESRVSLYADTLCALFMLFFELYRLLDVVLLVKFHFFLFEIFIVLDSSTPSIPLYFICIFSLQNQERTVCMGGSSSSIRCMERNKWWRSHFI